MKILIDNGHGRETKGKMSPCGSFREWEWTRMFARALMQRLQADGADVSLLVHEDSDVSLAERIRRANAFGRDALLLSIHNNAAGDGSMWHRASGFSAFVAPRASPLSRSIAAALTRAAAAAGLAGNRATPPQGYWTASLAICRDSLCPAVLTENLFMDNRADLALLQSDSGVKRLLDIHLQALVPWI
ncbi:MAG: N-acetylmuramoyl-L-alanine amidase [Muribaculaceae bacterium]|nr:N-acetylmuramoyl-L-alanine amidase [Muribaculaceae bacterium]